MKQVIYECDTCRNKAIGNFVTPPKGWYILGFSQATDPGLSLIWIPTHEFCSEKCLDVFMKPSVDIHKVKEVSHD